MVDDARVGIVICGNVDGLEGCYGALLGGRDAFLKGAHLRRQGGLIAHRRGHPSQQRRYLHARQDVPVDVVYEQEHVLVLLVPEVLGHGQAREADPGPDAGGLIHLSKHQNGAAHHPRCLHLVPEVVALSGAFPNAGEYRHTLVDGGYVAYQLHDDHGLADAGATVGADLTAFHEGGYQVKDLDSSLQKLGCSLLLLERGRRPVDGPVLLRLYGSQVIQGISGHVKQATQGLLAYWYHHRALGVDGLYTPGESLGGPQGQATYPAIAYVLLDLKGELLAIVVYLYGIEEPGELIGGELHVYYRADNLDHFAFTHFDLRYPRLDYLYTAATPPMMSSSSLVMLSCRTLLATRVRSATISPAFSVALRMATMRADCSLAISSSNAW